MKESLENKKGSFLAVRHSYDDHKYLDGKNDTDLTEEGIKIAKKAAIQIYPYIYKDVVLIRHTPKKRGYQTADIICEYLLKKGITCTYINEPNLIELWQGDINFKTMEHVDKVNFLQSCWDVFNEHRMSGDLTYRFGQEKNGNVIENPGNCFKEWTCRIAEALLRNIFDIECGIQSINVTHRGVIHDMEQIIKYVNGEIAMDSIETYPGRRMQYCQEEKLEFNDIEKAKILIKEYKQIRS